MSRNRGRIFLLVGLVSSALFIALAIRRLEIGTVTRAFGQANLMPWLPLAVGSYLCGHVVRGVRCRMLVSREAKLGLSTATNVVVLGYAVNNVLPARLGEIARAGLLAQTSGLPFVQSLTVTVLERVLDGLCLLLLLVVAGQMLPDPGWIKTTLELGGLVFGVATIGVVLAVAAPSALLGITGRVAHKFGSRVHDLAVKLVSQLVAGVSYVRTFSSAIAVTALSILVWLFEAGMFFALLPAFGIRADPWLALVAMCVTNLGILAPSTPGFIGPFHFFAMRAVALAGVSEPVAFSYAVLVHLSFYIPITLWGVGIAFTYGISLGEMLSRARDAKPMSGERRPLASIRHAPPVMGDPRPFMVALCDALLPVEAELDRKRVTNDVARFVEKELADLPGRLATLFGIGMFGFRMLTLLAKFSRLEKLAPDARRRWIERWAYGSFALGRQLFRGVRSTALLAYYEHPDVRALMLPARVELAGELVELGKKRNRAEA